MRYSMVFLCATLLLDGCASFSGKMIRKNEVGKHPNKHQFSGIYELFPDKQYADNGDAEPVDKKSVYNIYNAISNRTLAIDSSAGYHCRLDLVTDKTMKVTLFKETQAADSIVLTGKLKRNGLFYPDNSELKCHGIPYLFGGCKHGKSRIGITADGGLFINDAFDNTGAFLFFIWAGYSYNSGHHFKRIE